MYFLGKSEIKMSQKGKTLDYLQINDSFCDRMEVK